MVSHLTLEIGFSDERDAQKWDDSSRGSDSVLLAGVETLRLSLGSSTTLTTTSLGVIFLPRLLTQRFMALAATRTSSSSKEAEEEQAGGGLADWNSTQHGSLPLSLSASPEFSSRFMASIHPELANEKLHAILFCSDTHSAADVVLFDLASASQLHLHHLLDVTNNRVIHDTSQGHFLLKLLVVSDIRLDASDTKLASASSAAMNDETPSSFELPTCPLCIHRIDPVRVGLLKPRNAQLCSQFCPPPTILQNGTVLEDESCKKQQLLRPWPAPSRCLCCHNIYSYWTQTPEQTESHTHCKTELADMFCYKCPMQETLWVCLTCGFVGCGRYSNGHAAEHFYETHHPYSLELATLRIWDYVDSEYAHRADLLECPSSPPMLHPFQQQLGGGDGNGNGGVSYSAVDTTHDGTDFAAVAAAATSMTTHRPDAEMVSPRRRGGGGVEKTPKKASMIGEEYEALLQSALEDQAQHYEGEMARLRAELTAEQVDASRMTEEERKEAEELQRDISMLRSKIDAMSREVLSAQAQEAGHRAISQRLLREQQVAQDLIATVKEETATEQEQGRWQMEELEQQIADLTANQRMRHQFSQDEELLHAQVYGTQTVDATGKDKQKKAAGTKSRRLLRK